MAGYPQNYGGYNQQPPPPGVCYPSPQQQPYYPPPPEVCQPGPYYPQQPPTQTIIREDEKRDDWAKDCLICALCTGLCCYCCLDH